MDPLPIILMPTHGVLIGMTTVNSWLTGSDALPVLLAYIATDSVERLSFVSLQTAPRVEDVLCIASRPSRLHDMAYGLVIEVHLARRLEEAETVYVSLAHAGATTYYPPQPISDLEIDDLEISDLEIDRMK